MAKMNWKQAVGKVIKIQSINARGRQQFIVTFSYEAQGQLYEGERYTFSSMIEGDSFDVKYDSSNPKRTEFDAKYHRTWWIWWSVMAAVVAVALFLMLWIRLN